MSSPLDRIEARLAAAREDVATRPYSHPIGIGWYAEDVLALVNVAKAAEGVMTQMDYETPHHTRLREALAALGKEPQA